MEVNFSKKYPYAPYLNLDIGAKETEDIKTKEEYFAMLDKLNEWSNEWYATRYKDYYYEQVGVDPTIKLNEIKVEKPNITPTESIIQRINKCTQLDGAEGLKSYELIAKSKPEIQTAYNDKFSQLSNTVVNLPNI